MIHVGLASWIVQDGNYGDFKIGEEYRFALEFYPLSVKKSRISGTNLSHISGAVPEASGKVIFSSDRVWGIDCGIQAYREGKPPRFAKVGTWLSGQIYLGIDPFFYFERLCHEPGIPDLFRRFRVVGIQIGATTLQSGVVGQNVMHHCSLHSCR